MPPAPLSLCRLHLGQSAAEMGHSPAGRGMKGRDHKITEGENGGGGGLDRKVSEQKHSAWRRLLQGDAMDFNFAQQGWVADFK